MIEPDWTSPCGNVQLYCGDCIDVMPRVGLVDVVFTSPPYNCGMEYEQDVLPESEYWVWLESAVAAAAAAIHRHGYLVVNHGNWMGSREGRSFILDELLSVCGRYLPFRDLIIWDKGPPKGAAWGNFRTSPRIRAGHENIVVFGGVEQMPPSNIEWDEWSRLTCSIWRVASTVDLSEHPAQMPTEIARRVCMLFSPERGCVLDPFMGSGTTGVTSVQLGRKFIGIELDPGYFEIAKRRIMDALGMETKRPDGLTQRRLFQPEGQL